MNSKLNSTLLLGIVIVLVTIASGSVTAIDLNASCGYKIIGAGTYYLNDTLSCNGGLGPGAGLEIAVDDVTLDCNGFDITNTDRTGAGIRAWAHDNVSIRNCDVSGFEKGADLFVVSDSTYTTLNLHDNTIGLRLGGSDDNTFTDVTTDNNVVGTQIEMGSTGNSFDSLIATGNRDQGIYLRKAADTTFTDTQVSLNGAEGVKLDTATNTVINMSCVITQNNGDGIYVKDSDVIVSDTSITDNTGRGIFADPSTLTLQRVTVSGNGGKALDVQDSTILIQESSFVDNGEGVYLEDVLPDTLGASITGNTFTGNTGTELTVTTFTSGRLLTNLQDNVTGNNDFGTVEPIAVKQRLRAYFHVSDYDGSDVADATVNVYDYGSPFVTNTLTTDASGETHEVLVTSYTLDYAGNDPGTELRAVAEKTGFGRAEVRVIPVNVSQRIEIGFLCGRTFSSDTVLAQDIDCNGRNLTIPNTPSAAVRIIASNIVFDCNGHQIINTGKTGSGIQAWAVNNVTIKNCDVSGFQKGIDLFISNSDTLENNIVHDNSNGIILANVNTGVMTSDNVVRDNDAVGITIEQGSSGVVVSGEISDNGEEGTYIKDSSSTTIDDATIRDNALEGVYLVNANVVLIEDSTVSNNKGGFVSDAGNAGNTFTVQRVEFSNNGIAVRCFQNTVEIIDSNFTGEETGFWSEECVGNVDMTGNTFSGNTNATVFRNADVDDFAANESDFFGLNTFTGNTWNLIQDWTTTLLVQWANLTPTENASYNVRDVNGALVANGVTNPFGTAQFLVREIATPGASSTYDFVTPTNFTASKLLITGFYGENVTTIDQQLTVIITLAPDTTPPVIAFHANITVEATSPAGANVTYTPPDATDNVDPTAPADCSPASGTIFPLGITTVTCTKTDASGNNATPTTFSVIVVDTTAPVSSVNASPYVFGTWTNQNVNVRFNCTDTASGCDNYPYHCIDTTNTCTPDTPTADLFIVNEGTWYVRYFSRDIAGNTEATQSVIVMIDKTAPVVFATVSNLTNVSVHINASTNEVSHFITFWGVGSLTMNIHGGNGTTTGATLENLLPNTTYLYTVQACDLAGNCGTTSGTFTTLVSDSTPPVIAFHANITVEATSPAGANVTYTPPDATDNVDPTAPATCLPASGTIFPLGLTTVTCTKSDAMGNAAVPTTFNVFVVDTTAPLIAAHANINVQTTSSTGAIVNYTAPTYTDAVSGNGTATCLPVSGTMFTIGSHTITCSATDGANNTGTSTFTITVTRNNGGGGGGGSSGGGGGGDCGDGYTRENGRCVKEVTAPTESGTSDSTSGDSTTSTSDGETTGTTSDDEEESGTVSHGDGNQTAEGSGLTGAVTGAGFFGTTWPYLLALLIIIAIFFLIVAGLRMSKHKRK